MLYGNLQTYLTDIIEITHYTEDCQEMKMLLLLTLESLILAEAAVVFNQRLVLVLIKEKTQSIPALLSISKPSSLPLGK